MPTDSESLDLLGALLKEWAGHPSAVTWTPAATTAVWPALRAHKLEASLGRLIPADALTPAQSDDVHAAMTRTGVMLMELERILPGLERADCAPIVLKGAGLALTLYPDPLQRWFADLDLLVPRDRLETACSRLEALGYQPHPSRGAWKQYDRNHFHRILRGPRGSMVELHWDLTLPHSVYHYDLAGLRDRTAVAMLGQHPCVIATPLDQILHSVYQNIANGFADLHRVVDLVLLCRSLTPHQWRELVEIAAAAGLDRGLELTLHIVKLNTGLAVPDLDYPRPLEPWAWRLIETLDVPRGQLDRRSKAEAGYHDCVHWVLVPTARLRLRETFRLLYPRPQLGEQGRRFPLALISRALAGGRNLLRMAGYGRRACRASH